MAKNKYTHASKSKQIFKSSLAYESLLSNNISDTSRNNKTSRKTVYKYRNETELAINVMRHV